MKSVAAVLCVCGLRVVWLADSVKRGHFFPTWRERFAELDVKTGKLEYFTNATKSKSKGDLTLGADSKVEVREAYHKGLNCCVVSGSGGSITFHTKDDTMTAAAIDALKAYVASLG